MLYLRFTFILLIKLTFYRFDFSNSLLRLNYFKPLLILLSLLLLLQLLGWYMIRLLFTYSLTYCCCSFLLWLSFLLWSLYSSRCSSRAWGRESLFRSDWYTQRRGIRFRHWLAFILTIMMMVVTGVRWQDTSRLGWEITHTSQTGTRLYISSAWAAVILLSCELIVYHHRIRAHWERDINMTCSYSCIGIMCYVMHING